MILGEVEGKTKIPPSSYNAALYYDGRIKKSYVVIFDEGGNVGKCLYVFIQNSYNPIFHFEKVGTYYNKVVGTLFHRDFRLMAVG